jgi:ABC-type transport system substrate-binding protein
MLDRVFNRRDYDLALMALDSGDIDPNSQMNVWRTGGTLHLWNLSGQAHQPWEEEVDELMSRQMVTLGHAQRKSFYDRVQKILVDQVPVICLVSPHVLLAATQRLGNFQPSILRPNALWNADSLYFRQGR